MKKGITYQAIKNRKITIFLIVFTLVIGLYSYHMLPRQESPDVSPPVANVIAVYPGASPENVEKLVTKKIEETLVEVKGYKHVETTSKEGISIAVIFLKEGTDTDESWDDMKNKLDALQSQLPKECLPMEINTELVNTAGMIISMAGDNYSYEELSDYAETFKDELRKINGIKKMEINGEVNKDIKVEVDMNQLNYYNLSLGDISNIIKAQNTEIPSGKIDDGKNKIAVKTKGTYSSLEEIQNTIIKVSPDNGTILRVKDIANVYYEIDESDAKYKQNDKKAVLITGYFEDTLNVVLVGKEVEKKIKELRTDLPDDIVFEQVTFQPHDVEKSISNFIINLLEAILFVVAVVFFGMGGRNAIVVSTTIPLAICMTLGSMYALGIKLEQMSISALIIALGMLVDNAIVVSDSIQNYIDEGLDRLEACVRGTKEIAMSMFTSTLTTVFAFLPLLLLKSSVGMFMFGIPSVVIISLLSSYICALISTPLMAYFLFEKSKNEEVEKDSKVRNVFDKLLQLAMKRNVSMIIIIIIGLIGAGILATQLEVSMFPKADKDIVYISITSENASDIKTTEKLSKDVTEILKNQPEVLSYTEVIGAGLPKFYMTAETGPKSSDYAQILMKIDLKKGKRFKLRSEFISCLQTELDNNIIGGKASAQLLDVGSGGGSPIQIRVATDKMERLEEVTQLVTEEIQKIEGTINVNNDFAAREYKFYVDVNENKSGNYGISKFDVQKEVSNALKGNNASIFRKDENDYAIVVTSNIKTKEELENMAIKSSLNGKKVLLKEIADIRVTAEYPIIERYNRERTANITSDLLNGYTAKDVEEKIKERIKELDLDDVTFDFDGMMGDIKESFSALGILSIIALFLIISILIFQFNSYSDPIVILLTVPLSFIGGIVGLFVTNQPMSFTATLGMVSLMGIVVNNAIVLIEFINSEREKGKTAYEACKVAVNRRFRPIVLSTITTVIGLIPLVIGGGETFRPMAISLMSGLSISTILTLVVTPTIYSMVSGMVEKVKNKEKVDISNKAS